MKKQKISESTVDKVRNLSAIDVIGDRVLLKRKGNHSFGLCPFHDEKTPSFAVNEGKNLYYCYGCQRGGDVIHFVEEIDSLSFAEAVLSLADRHGISVEFEDSADTDEYRREVSQRRKILDALEAAQRYFHSNWVGGRNYLRDRGVGDDAVEAFGIGFAPDAWNSIEKALPQFDRQTLADAGLLVERSGAIYDRFRNRITFPIHDNLGRVVAFGGRAVGDAKPKYLNSPENIAFKKGEILYNARNASKAIGEAGEVIVVEGYLDVIALWNAGLKNAVATMGTAFSFEAIAPLLSRCRCRRVILNFDPDDAGRLAADRAVRETYRSLCSGDLDVKVVELPGGDVDDYLRNGGADYPRKIGEASSGLAWAAGRLAEDRDLGDPADLKAVVSGAVKMLRDIPDEALRALYLEKFAGAIAAGKDSAIAGQVAALLGRYLTRPIVAQPDSPFLSAEEADLSALRAYVTLNPAELERVEAELALYGVSLPEEGGSCFFTTAQEPDFVARALTRIADRRCHARYNELRRRFVNSDGATEEEKNAMRCELTALRDRLFPNMRKRAKDNA